MSSYEIVIGPNNCQPGLPPVECCTEGSFATDGAPNKRTTVGLSFQPANEPPPAWQTALTITRTCAGVGEFWASCNGSEILIDGCVFTTNCRASTAAAHITNALAPHVTATGTNAWLGLACPSTTTNCNACLPTPVYQWRLQSITPTVAVFEARPALGRSALVTFSSEPNSAYDCLNGGCVCYDCYPPAGWAIGGTWTTNTIWAEYGVVAHPSQFALTLYTEFRPTGFTCWPMTEQGGLTPTIT